MTMLKDESTAVDAFHRAIELAGTESSFAKVCGCTPGNINQLVKRKSVLPARFVIKVEAATGVSRHDLRPDLYPREPFSAEPPASSVADEAGGKSAALGNMAA